MYAESRGAPMRSASPPPMRSASPPPTAGRPTFGGSADVCRISRGSLPREPCSLGPSGFARHSRVRRLGRAFRGQGDGGLPAPGGGSGPGRRRLASSRPQRASGRRRRRRSDRRCALRRGGDRPRGPAPRLLLGLRRAHLGASPSSKRGATSMRSPRSHHIVDQRWCPCRPSAILRAGAHARDRRPHDEGRHDVLRRARGPRGGSGHSPRTAGSRDGQLHCRSPPMGGRESSTPGRAPSTSTMCSARRCTSPSSRTAPTSRSCFPSSTLTGGGS